jgi:hypothetical protein
MVGSTGSQPRVSVKRRGSKRHTAQADDWADTEARRWDGEGGMKRAGEAGGSWGDDGSLDPARDGKAPALAK